MGAHANLAARDGMSPEARDQVLRLGMWMFLGTVTMLFGAFSSAYIVRGAGTDWRAVTLPSILWLNTAVILVSSATLEFGKRQARAHNWAGAKSWLLLTLLLGITFLVGQVVAWQVLSRSGVAIPTTPYGSFFYVLSGVHAVHLIAGLTLLAVAARRAVASSRADADPTRERTALRVVDLGAILWHFLAGLWVYLLVLLTFFR
jgi:cytochrome c oxidase subunit 3